MLSVGFKNHYIKRNRNLDDVFFFLRNAILFANLQYFEYEML